MSQHVAELLRRISANPEDTAARLVLADVWVEEGDLRGDLIQVQHSLASAKGQRFGPLFSREESLAKLLRRRILGPKLARTHADLSFALGFVDEVALDVADPQSLAVLESVCASESGVVLRALVLRVPPREDAATASRRQIDGFLTKVAKITWPGSLRRLEICAAEAKQTYFNDAPAEQHVTRVLKVFPNLRELRVELDDVRLSPMSSPVLASFEWLGASVAPGDLDALARWSLPALERFALVTSGQRVGAARVTPKTLLPAFELLDRARSLRELSLRRYAGDVAELVGAMTAHEFLPRLGVLDLEGVDMDAASAVELTRRAQKGLKLSVGSVTPDARTVLAAGDVIVVTDHKS